MDPVRHGAQKILPGSHQRGLTKILNGFGIFFRCPVGNTSIKGIGKTGIYFSDLSEALVRGTKFFLAQRPAPSRQQAVSGALRTKRKPVQNSAPLSKKFEFIQR